MEETFRVGVIASTHGIRGEVKVFPTTEDPARFEDLKECILQTKQGPMTLHVTGVKYSAQFVILKFKEFDNINQVEGFRNLELFVTRENAIPLEEDEYYVADLLGFSVISEEGQKIGTLTEVLKTGANDCLVVTDRKKKEILFPMIKECVLDVRMESREILVHVMDGLLD